MNLNVLAPPDTNGNSLPDAWETAYGLNNPAADQDADGHSNFAEYLANTNPTNAASALRIISVTRNASGHVTLVWSSVGGTRYRAQYLNANLGSNAFTDIVRPLSAEMDPAPYNQISTRTFVDDFTLTGGATNASRYYRIRIVQ